MWLSLIHGANGITVFSRHLEPSFREDGIFADSAMVAAVTALNQQILSLAPVLNSATITNLVGVTSSPAAVPIDTMVKAQGQTLFVFAAVAQRRDRHGHVHRRRDDGRCDGDGGRREPDADRERRRIRGHVRAKTTSTSISST